MDMSPASYFSEYCKLPGFLFIFMLFSLFNNSDYNIIQQLYILSYLVVVGVHPNSVFKSSHLTLHYYYSFEDPPGVLKNDVELPGLMNELMNIDIVTYWHGYGTLTKPHTDAMENMSPETRHKKLHVLQP